MTGLLIALVILVSITLITVVVGLVFYFRRLDAVARELEETLRTTRDEIVPVMEDTRRVLRHTNELIVGARAQVDRAGRVMESVQDLVEGKTIVGAAEKAVTSSRATLSSMLQNIKEHIKTIRSSKAQSEEQ